MKEKYSSEHANLSAILSSHARQVAARDRLEKALGVKAVTIDDFKDHLFRTCIPGNPFAYARPDLLLVLGGDNSFTAVAARSCDVPIMAINSDPVSSVGYLTRWRIDTDENFATTMQAIEGEHNVEDWTRLEDNLVRIPAISEMYLGETKRKDMSRLVIEFGGESYETKCSGLVVATGVGSTGWYHSINADRTLEENQFAPTDKLAKFVVTEPYRSNNAHILKRGEFGVGDKLVVHSLNDDGGLISTDSWWEAPFTRGMTAEITIGEPAKIVVPK